MFRDWISGWSSISFVTLERPAIRQVQYHAVVAYALREVLTDSPFALVGGREASGRLSEATTRVSRSAYRLALTLVLWLGAWYFRRSVNAIADPQADDDTEA
jgi:hypothetical protein